MAVGGITVAGAMGIIMEDIMAVAGVTAAVAGVGAAAHRYSSDLGLDLGITVVRHANGWAVTET